MVCRPQDISALFSDSDYHMADVTGKAQTFRRALATGRIDVGEQAFTRIAEGTLPKGDVLKLAEIAGINGAKNTAQTIPLCHPLPLDHIALQTELDAASSSVTVYCLVATFARTGVEMEALAGVNAALLTLYDLTKPVEPALTISGIRLLLKEGGKKGRWLHPDGVPTALENLIPTESKQPLEGVSAAVITLSDRASEGEYEDRSGALLRSLLEDLGADASRYSLIPDEGERLDEMVCEYSSDNLQLIITTGGTGLAARDITPETLENLCDLNVPGIGELLRHSGARHLQHAWLSRSYAGIRNGTLIIALPGSTGAVREGIEAMKGILPHALELIAGRQPQHKKTPHD